MTQRPLYETAQDQAGERETLQIICDRLQCQAVKLPLNARADYLLHTGGNAKTIIEIKHRTNSMGKYDTYMLSRGKYRALENWSQMGFHAAIFVQWTDALGYVKVPTLHTTGRGGRYDRNDPQDVEQVVYIPTCQFKIIQGADL